MFRAAELVLITKSDLLEVLGDFDPGTAESYLRQIANPAPQLVLSARSGTGMNAWLEWIRDSVAGHR
jgi:hydrogenase nickel incorporation protein HypB